MKPTRNGPRPLFLPGGIWPPRLILCFTLAVCLMVFLTSVEGALFRLHRGQPIDWTGLVSGRAAAWFTCAAFVPPLYMLTTRFPIERTGWAIAVPVHLGGSVLAALGKYSLYLPLTLLLDGTSTGEWLSLLRKGFLGQLMFYWAMTAVVHAVFFYIRTSPSAADGSTGQTGGAAADQVSSSRLALAVGLTTEMVDPDDIAWIKAEGNYVRLDLGKRQLLVRHTLAGIETRLSDQFLRVHRSTIINAAKVTRIEPAGQGKWKIWLTGAEPVTSGRSYKNSVRELLS